MSITTESNPLPLNVLYPLTKRIRTETVTAQLTEMSRLPRGQVLRRIGETDKNKWLARETLVTLARAYTRAGDEETARRALEILLARQRPAIAARVRAWRTLETSDHEDVEGQIVVKLMEYVANLTPSEEFWECNFTSCFDLRTVNILKAFAARRTPAISAFTVTASGEERDLLAEVPDISAEARFQDIEVEELRASLSRDNPQIEEFLYLHLAGMTEAKIAARLGVTDRTLRNWKTKMRAALSQEI